MDRWAHNFGREIHRIMFSFYFYKQVNYVNNLLINKPENKKCLSNLHPTKNSIHILKFSFHLKHFFYHFFLKINKCI